MHTEETETSFAVGWQGRYRFAGDTFVCEDNWSLRLSAIRGYPVKQLLGIIGRSRDTARFQISPAGLYKLTFTHSNQSRYLRSYSSRMRSSIIHCTRS